MKKNVRLVLLFALIAVMLVMTAVFASAATTEADLKTEIAAGNATVAGDITLTEGITIDKATTITGTGTITFTGEGAAFTVTGSGNVTFDGVKLTAATACNLIVADTLYSGTLTLNNCELTLSAAGYIVYTTARGVVEVTGDSTSYLGDGASGIFYIATVKGSDEQTLPATLNIRAGEFTGNCYDLLAIKGGTTVRCVANIYGGSFTANGSCGFSVNNDGALNIYDGTFVAGTASKMMFYVSDGYAVLHIEGGSFTQNGIGTDQTSYWEGSYLIEKRAGAVEIDKAEGKTLTFEHTGAGPMFKISAACNYSDGKGNVPYTFKGATFTHTGSGAIFAVGGSATLNLENCTISHTGADHARAAEGANASNDYLVGANESPRQLYATVLYTAYNGKANVTFENTSVTYNPETSACGCIWLFRSGATFNVTGTGTYDIYKYSFINYQGTNIVNISGSPEVNAKAKFHMFKLRGPNDQLNISGGTFNSHTTAGEMIYLSDSGIVNITGGTLNGSNSNIIYGTAQYASKVTISGGVLNGSANLVRFGDHANQKISVVTISGGTINVSGTGTAVYLSGPAKLDMTGGTINTVLPAESVLGGASNGGGYAVRLDGSCTEHVMTDCTVNGTISVGGTIQLTINGGTYANPSYYYAAGVAMPILFMNSGSPTITVNGGTFTAAGRWDTDGVCYTNQTNATFNFAGGTFTNTGEGNVIRKNSGSVHISGTAEFSAANGACLQINNTTNDVSITGGIFEGYMGVRLACGESVTISNAKFDCANALYLANASSTATVTIESGTFAATDRVIYAAGATLVIEGGNFSTENGSIVTVTDNDVISGVTISGGTFTATGTGVPFYYDINEGERYNTHVVGGPVVISGGTFTAANAAAVRIVTGKNIANSVTISGGKFVSNDKSTLFFSSATDKMTLAVTGGTFQLTGTEGNSSPIKIGTSAYWYTCKAENFGNDGLTEYRGYTLETWTTLKAQLGTTYANKGAVTISGAMVVNSNPVSTDAIYNADAGATGVVTLGDDLIVLNVNANGYFYNCATSPIAVNAAGAQVKYDSTSHYIWMALAGEADAELDNGASVRVDATAEMTGIRFTGSATKVEGAVYGIIIAPADYVAAAGAFTKEALDTWAAAKSIAVPYVMAEAQKSLHDNGDGTVSFSVALVDIQSGNYDRSFAAVPYVTVGGETTYGDYDSTNNARSMKSVATEALADYLTSEQFAALDPEVAAKYIYTITIDGVKYASKYDADDRTALEKYTV